MKSSAIAGSEPTSNASPPLADDERLVGGRYRLERVVGVGGMGTVYAAVHAVTGKRVAVKRLRPSLASRHGAAERFVREARAASRIDHRNVVDVHDVGEDDGTPFLVMELLRGRSLAEHLAETGPLPLEEAMAILESVARGVAAAHARGVVHRDLKPANVFLRVDEVGVPLEPKVLDFGISRVDDEGLSATTETGRAVGTPHYMAPEQMVGAATVTPAADVYALGVLFFEMLTGTRPRQATNLAALVLEVHTARARRLDDVLPGIPRGVADAVASALEADASRRTPSVAAFVDDVRAHLPSGTPLRLPTFVVDERPDRYAAIEARAARDAIRADAERTGDVSTEREVGASARTPSTGIATPGGASPVERAPGGSFPEAVRADPGSRGLLWFAALAAFAALAIASVALVALYGRDERPSGATARAPRGRIELRAAEFAGAEIFVDGEPHGAVGPEGTARVDVEAGRRFVELRRTGVPAVGTMVRVDESAHVVVDFAGGRAGSAVAERETAPAAPGATVRETRTPPTAATGASEAARSSTTSPAHDAEDSAEPVAVVPVPGPGDPVAVPPEANQAVGAEVPPASAGVRCRHRAPSGICLDDL